MDTRQTSFQDRLRKIERRQADTLVPAGGHTPPPEIPEPVTDRAPRKRRRRARNDGQGSQLLMMLGAAGVILAGAAIYLRDVAGPPADPALGGETRQVSLLGQWMGGMFDPGAAKGAMPVAHLPDAPEGWVLVTRKDARRVSAIAQIEAAWPPAPNGSVLPLSENLGFKALKDFVKDAQVKNNKTQALAKTQSTAMLLAANGDFLRVELHFLEPGRSLGATADPEVWAEGLAALEASNLKSGWELERNVLAGMPILNRMRPAGGFAGDRAIGDLYDVPVNLRVAAPISDRAFIRLHGHATPNLVGEVLSSLNTTAIQAALR